MKGTVIKTSNNEYYESIALEIKKQLHLIPAFVWSWGARQWSWGVTDKNEVALTFLVNGLKFQGRVTVIYDAMDYYRIEFINEESGEIVDTVDEAYCDNMYMLVDEKVESQDSYQ